MNKFKIGDKAVCIDASRIRFLNENLILELNKIYTISYLEGNYHVSLKEMNSDFGFSINRFITLKEYRKLKIDRLNEQF